VSSSGGVMFVVRAGVAAPAAAAGARQTRRNSRATKACRRVRRRGRRRCCLVAAVPQCRGRCFGSSASIIASPRMSDQGKLASGVASNESWRPACWDDLQAAETEIDKNKIEKQQI